MEDEVPKDACQTTLDDVQCPICYDDVVSPATIITENNACCHKFCLACIHRWSREVNTCPTCRERFNAIQYHDENNNEKLIGIEEHDTDQNIMIHFARVAAFTVAMFEQLEQLYQQRHQRHQQRRPVVQRQRRLVPLRYNDDNERERSNHRYPLRLKVTRPRR
jgi:hypothetical protein